MKEKIVILIVSISCLLLFTLDLNGYGFGNHKVLEGKYSAHKYTIEIVSRKEIVSNENLMRSICKGPGSTTINLTGSFSGSVKTSGGLMLGSLLNPIRMNVSVGGGSTKSITLSQNYTLSMSKSEDYIIMARPIFEYCKFNVVYTNPKNGKTTIKDTGSYERPIGLYCTHYCITENHDELKPISLSDREKSLSSTKNSFQKKGEELREDYYRKLGITKRD